MTTKTLTYRCPCGQEWTRERARGVGSKSLSCPAGCPERPLEVHECPTCEREWSRPVTRGMAPRACPECQNGGNRRVRTACIICRAPVVKTRNQLLNYRPSCSGECRGYIVGGLRPRRSDSNRPGAAKVREVAECPGCASPFIKRAHGQRFCTHRCRENAKARTTADARVRFVAGHCHGCGEYFVAEDWTGSGRWCSTRCLTKDARNKRRARTRGAYVEPASWKLVARRDGLVCYLCMEECDPDDFSYGVGSDGRRVFLAGMRFPTLEHVLALDNGGEHSMANGRLAHLLCNSQKGTTLLAS